MPDDTPLHLDASAYVDHLARIEDASAAEIERYKHVRDEIDRRDGAAQWYTALFFRLCCVLVVALLVSLSVNIYQLMQARQVQAFVQVVQQTEEGRLVQVGIPMDLLAYQPTDAMWMDLLAQWVVHFRWRTADPVLMRTLWAFLYSHTCGDASKFLAADEVKEQPFKGGRLRTSIEVKSITKTDTPQSYQVLFRERTIDTGGSSLTEYDVTGTFTVSRKKPKTLEEARDNHLGLCVNGYSLSRKRL